MNKEMVERITESKIIIEIQTNKTSYKEEFEYFNEAKKYYDNIIESIE